MLAEEREPSSQPSSRAVSHWRLAEASGVVPLWIVASSLLFAAQRTYAIEFLTSWQYWACAASLLVVALLWFVAFLPAFSVRYQRHELMESGLYCQTGLLRRTRVIVPYARVQSVLSQRGILERRLGLTSLVIQTSASAHKVRMLDEDVADELRDRICDLARSSYDDL